MLGAKPPVGKTQDAQKAGNDQNQVDKTVGFCYFPRFPVFPKIFVVFFLAFYK